MCNCSSAGPGLCVEGKKALSEIYFYQLISRCCWRVSAVVITIPSSSLHSGVTVRQGMQQPAWLLIPMAEFNSFQAVPLNPRAHSVGGAGMQLCRSSSIFSRGAFSLVTALCFLSAQRIYCLLVGAEVWRLLWFASGWVTGLEPAVKGRSFPNSCSYLLILNYSGRSVWVGTWPGRTSSDGTLVFCFS